jgi:hypothetical protein
MLKRSTSSTFHFPKDAGNARDAVDAVVFSNIEFKISPSKDHWEMAVVPLNSLVVYFIEDLAS